MSDRENPLSLFPAADRRGVTRNLRLLSRFRGFSSSGTSLASPGPQRKEGRWRTPDRGPDEDIPRIDRNEKRKKEERHESTHPGIPRGGLRRVRSGLRARRGRARGSGGEEDQHQPGLGGSARIPSPRR